MDAKEMLVEKALFSAVGGYMLCVIRDAAEARPEGGRRPDACKFSRSRRVKFYSTSHNN